MFEKIVQNKQKYDFLEWFSSPEMKEYCRGKSWKNFCFSIVTSRWHCKPGNAMASSAFSQQMALNSVEYSNWVLEWPSTSTSGAGRVLDYLTALIGVHPALGRPEAPQLYDPRTGRLSVLCEERSGPGEGIQHSWCSAHQGRSVYMRPVARW